MKAKRNLSTYLLPGACCAALALAACDSDIDPVYVLPADNVALAGASNDIILSAATPQALVLTLYWSGDGRLELSDSLLQAPVNAAETSILLSADEAFTSPLEIAVDKGVTSRQFLSEEFNALLGRMGYTAGEMSPLWIKVKTTLAANMSPAYSNALTVNVQSYRISLVTGNILNADGSESSMTLASPSEDGIYRGFMGVGGWTNWWFREANNVVWGNLGQDGKQFYASSADDHWNFWFPGDGGCYYTTLNTVEGWWSALHIDNLSVGGDIQGEMAYNQSANQWTLDVDLESAATLNITVSGAGSLYDRETTDMGPAKECTVAFGGSADALTFGGEPAAIAVSLPAGHSTLVLDLADPLCWTIGAGEAAPPEETDSRLYFSGLVTWDGFDDWLTLYDEGSLSYGGAHMIDSEWGYRVYTKPEWTAAYKAADGATPLAGTLVAADTDGNIPAPEPGLYVMDFNMKALTYELTAVERVSFTGLNDDWSEHDMQPLPDNPEVFVGEFVKEKETPWGVKVLINGNWSLFFGGSGGVLKLGHSDATTGFDGDNDLTIGETYQLTVDLGQQTYSYTKK